MRIVIDLQGAQSESRHRGIGRYSLALAQAMVRNRGEHEILIALNGMFPETIEPIRAAFAELLPQENIRVWHAAGPVHSSDANNTWRRHTAELIREAFLASLNPDVVHISSLIEGFIDNSVHSIGLFPIRIPTAATFYDVIPLIQSDVYLAPNPTFENLYREKLGHLSKVDLYLAISESSRLEAIKYLNTNSNYTINISAAADDIFSPIDINEATENALRTQFGLNRPFIMYSGATDERKNHLRLIKAFSMLPQEIRNCYQLAIVGKLPPGNKKKFESYAKLCSLKQNELIITDKVSDQDMVSLYNLCDLFVFPSWHEGFGLPALEAMSCGAPVIGSNTTSIPEVIGREDALFDPFDEQAISQKIADILTNNQLRKEFAEHGLKQSQKFTWDLSAKTAILALEKLHKIEPVPYKSNKEIISSLIKEIAKLSVYNHTEKDLIEVANSISKNNQETHKKQLFLDISQLVNIDSKTGIQRVVRSILHEFLLNPPDGFIIEPVYASSHELGYKYAKKFTHSFLHKTGNEPEDHAIDAFNGDIFLSLDLTHHVVHSQSSTYESLRNSGVLVYFVVYDILPILSPKLFRDGLQPLHSQWLTDLSKTDGALCISRAVADEMIDWLATFGPERLRPFKVGWFHLGADVSSSVPSLGFTINAKEVLSELSNRPTFLMVGTIEPRKGQMQTLLAFEALWAQGIDVNLVIVGQHGWNVDLLIEMLRIHTERNQRLFWLEGISDEYLEKVYAASTCLIAASEGEGFGLPLIEAAQHKLAIIARDIPVFREVAGEYAHYFSGTTPEALANSIAEWLRLEKAGKAPRSDAMPWLTWQQSTQNLLDVMLGGQWYQEWMPDDVHRYWGSDQRLGSQVGIRSGRNIETNSTAGYLLFGPYLALAAGQYQVALHGQFGAEGAQGAHLDITTEGGKQIVALTPLLDTANPCLITHVFTLNTASTDLEVRVWVNERTALTVSLIEIAAHQSAISSETIAISKADIIVVPDAIQTDIKKESIVVSSPTPKEQKATTRYPNKKSRPAYSNNRKNKR